MEMNEAWDIHSPYLLAIKERGAVPYRMHLFNIDNFISFYQMTMLSQIWDEFAIDDPMVRVHNAISARIFGKPSMREAEIERLRTLGADTIATSLGVLSKYLNKTGFRLYGEVLLDNISPDGGIKVAALGKNLIKNADLIQVMPAIRDMAEWYPTEWNYLNELIIYKSKAQKLEEIPNNARYVEQDEMFYVREGYYRGMYFSKTF